MAQGLSVENVVNVQWTLTPRAVGVRNFGALLLMGYSDVIDVSERMRVYSSIDGVLADFSDSTPEYAAANLFFGQSPQPSTLYIGRWAKTATAGRLYGGLHAVSVQTALLNALKLITDGSIVIPVDGVNRTLTGLDFSAATTLAGCAAVIDTALTQGVVSWNATLGRFEVVSGTTGGSSAVGYATNAGSGTAIAATVKLTSGTAYTPVAGIAAETPVTALTTAAQKDGDWYGCMFADSAFTDQNHLDVAAYIESASPSRIYGLTTAATGVIDPNSTSDIAYVLKGLEYQRTFVQYSTSSAYAVASLFGRAFTVDFTANNTTITIKFKQEPGVTAELLTETQAATLDVKNVNYFVRYNNSVAIIQQGVMVNGYFFDEVHGADAFSGAAQTALWNRLYTSPTKIPQTDQGIAVLTADVDAVCEQFVSNGMIAPGKWTGPTIGPIKTGMTLPRGYFVYAPPVASQSQADREARKAPTMQVLMKLAGAVHSANVLVSINR